MLTEEALIDLRFLETLPGRKILIQGNHDYWWNSTSFLNDKFKTIDFLKNNCFTFNDYAICGTKGYIHPNDTTFSKQDTKLYSRELHRLEFSLNLAAEKSCKEIILMLHYPPITMKKENEFIKLIKKYNVKTVVYGHLHGKDNFNISYTSKVDNINYYLTSCDYLNFNPIKIL